MTNTFKNASIEVLNTATVLYTAPPATTTIVNSLTISNKDGAIDTVVKVEFFDASTAQTRIIGNTMPVPVGSVRPSRG